MMCVKLKSEANFEIMAYIKGDCCMNLAISGTETYNGLCLIHETYAKGQFSVATRYLRW